LEEEAMGCHGGHGRMIKTNEIQSICTDIGKKEKVYGSEHLA
jgi:hypothetical protein